MEPYKWAVFFFPQRITRRLYTISRPVALRRVVYVVYVISKFIYSWERPWELDPR